jgi:glycosyltransferase involved in cell wall biosynthesis
VIVIVAKPWVGFPSGTAATSRVAGYARGLAASGQDAHVILLGPSELNEATAENTEVTGVYRGIPFEYTSVSTVKSPSLLTRRWRVWSSRFAAGRRIRELAAASGVEAILLYSPWMSDASYFQRVARSVGAAYVLDLAEMPYHELAPGPARDSKQQRYGERFIGRFDLVVAVSRYLAEYAGKHLRPGAEVVVLPIMVDCDEYEPDGPSATDPRLVTYIGMLNEKKDGVATLMTAFSRLAPDFPDLALRLVGDSDEARVSNVPEFRGIAESLGVADRVEFTGQVRRAEIPGFLEAASVLALARPASQQADAGFPTKLGEYLASGRPTVVTRTSDIADYVRDGESAYLVPPGDIDALTDALRRVLADPEAAAEVGAAGRRVAEDAFDYRVTGRTLASALRRHRDAAASHVRGPA